MRVYLFGLLGLSVLLLSMTVEGPGRSEATAASPALQGGRAEPQLLRGLFQRGREPAPLVGAASAQVPKGKFTEEDVTIYCPDTTDDRPFTTLNTYGFGPHESLVYGMIMTDTDIIPGTTQKQPFSEEPPNHYWHILFDGNLPSGPDPVRTFFRVETITYPFKFLDSPYFYLTSTGTDCGPPPPPPLAPKKDKRVAEPTHGPAPCPIDMCLRPCYRYGCDLVVNGRRPRGECVYGVLINLAAPGKPKIVQATYYRLGRWYCLNFGNDNPPGQYLVNVGTKSGLYHSQGRTEVVN